MSPDVAITFRLDRVSAERLRKRARGRGESRSEFVRGLVLRELERWSNRPRTPVRAGGRLGSEREDATYVGLGSPVVGFPASDESVGRDCPEGANESAPL